MGRTTFKRKRISSCRRRTWNYIVYTDKINNEDNWGAKAKITYQKGAFNWYAQGAVMGLVANGGADQTKTFTGWRLKILVVVTKLISFWIYLYCW